jgi:hypothetical protein
LEEHIGRGQLVDDVEIHGFTSIIGDAPANDGLVIVFFGHVNCSLLRFSVAVDGADAPARSDMNVGRFSERRIPDIAFT